MPAERRQWDNRPWMLQTKTVFLSQPHKISAPVWSYDKQNDTIQQGKYENIYHVKCAHCNYGMVLPQDTKGDASFCILTNKLRRKWPVAHKWQVVVHQLLVGFSFSDAFHMKPDFYWTEDNIYRFTQRHVPQDGFCFQIIADTCNALNRSGIVCNTGTGFDVLTAIIVHNIVVFGVVTPCSMLGGYSLPVLH